MLLTTKKIHDTNTIVDEHRLRHSYTIVLHRILPPYTIVYDRWLQTWVRVTRNNVFHQDKSSEKDFKHISVDSVFNTDSKYGIDFNSIRSFYYLNLSSTSQKDTKSYFENAGLRIYQMASVF
jgi:hypothetical protein